MTVSIARMSQWHVAEIYEPDTWLPVPAEMTGPERTQWTRKVIESLRSSWGGEWQDEYAVVLVAALDGIAGTRQPGDGPLYLCWPLPAPMCMTIRINVFDSPLDREARPVQGEAVYHEAPGLGPGVHHVRERRDEILGHQMDLVAASFVFDDGRSTVVVETDEVPAAVANLVAPDLQRLVQSLVLRGPDGLSFRALPPPTTLVDIDDRWEVKDGA
ncbi:hypothetical protein [Ruania albidiflava]|uniref:hypothetical protein n=1 Tax=Ruania albidiflava TaxID=366586 RepID=UPI0023F382E3|nr:hypothetical protein [Ruania albidiflava]